MRNRTKEGIMKMETCVVLWGHLYASFPCHSDRANLGLHLTERTNGRE